mmetsp:Transcript_19244/g.53653  ORF Transcript_19244/g.53653 Transcript_19244/m.53653 type:complete len:81 (-) Transcript_19244:366-608(-)
MFCTSSSAEGEDATETIRPSESVELLRRHPILRLNGLKENESTNTFIDGDDGRQIVAAAAAVVAKKKKALLFDSLRRRLL